VIRRARFGVLAALIVTIGVAGPVTAALPIDSSQLREAVSADGALTHMEALQAIADANNDTRASGTPGYEASVAYVVEQLETAGYDVEVQSFMFEYEEVLEAALEQVSPASGETLVYNVDFSIATGSADADVTANVEAVDVLFHTNPDTTSTSGCEDADFAGFTAGDIALIQRGTCTFHEKVINAQEAGAAGIIIFNEGNTEERTELLFATAVGETAITIPVFGLSFEQGQTFYELSLGDLTLHMAADIFTEQRETWNVIAELEGQRDDRVVVVGAHLDSVLEGPGIQDNGSGSAMILDLAIQMANLGIEPVNTVRFAWWGAEESGLLGSEYYVSQLTKRGTKDIAVNLNFDMVASPNFVRFVYDGDAGPGGSPVVEDVFLDYFASVGLAVEPTDFDGRSDYGPFIDVGIPAGGLFTGAEGIKSAEEAAIYGGTADVAYDPCYHAACDDIDNVNLVVLEQMADAAAHATLTFAMTASAVQGTAQGQGGGHFKEAEFRGHRTVR
jgi:Zn-dependent M28 family amino/carboxypeptidase